jgi:hypothetical protein
MSAPPTLSADNVIAIHRRISKLESEARIWPRLRWFYALVCLVMAAIAVYCYHQGSITMYTAHHIALFAMDNPPKLDDVPEERKHAAEMAHYTLISATAHDISNSGVILFLYGAIQGLVSLVFAMVLYFNWNQSPWLLAQAQMLRIQVAPHIPAPQAATP